MQRWEWHLIVCQCLGCRGDGWQRGQPPLHSACLGRWQKLLIQSRRLAGASWTIQSLGSRFTRTHLNGSSSQTILDVHMERSFQIATGFICIVRLQVHLALMGFKSSTSFSLSRMSTGKAITQECPVWQFGRPFPALL